MSTVQEPSARRTFLVLTHALHLVVLALIGLATVLGIVREGNPLLQLGLGLALGAGYRLSTRHGWVLAILLPAWAGAAFLSFPFVWVVFALYFVVLVQVPRPWAFGVVAVLAAWSVWVSGAAAGPVIGALVAVLVWAGLDLQQRDADAYRGILQDLRAAQAGLAESEHTRGVLAERERLAREIHDTVAQGLSSIVVLSRTAQVADDPAPALAQIEAVARENLAEARRLVHAGSGPVVAIEDSLAATMADARRQVAAIGQGPSFEVVVEGESRPMSPATVSALGRAVSATVANVLQHARATRCRVGLTWFDDRVVVDVTDDGGGFDPGMVGPDSFGLRGTRARLGEAGGHVDIDSVPGEGTMVALVVPYASEGAQ